MYGKMNDHPTAAVRMHEGYYPDSYEQPDDQLDEFLCEYVDGTMDPAVKAAFEEFLEANPTLAAHARCLCRTRSMLCSYGGRHQRPSLESRIRKQAKADLDHVSRREDLLISRLGKIAMATSITSLVFILGMLVPFALIDSQQRQAAWAGGLSLEREKAVLPSDAPHVAVGTLTPADPRVAASHWTATGPASVLPAIDISPIGFHRASSRPVRWSALQLAAAP